jgi:hypothetical protein
MAREKVDFGWQGRTLLLLMLASATSPAVEPVTPAPGTRAQARAQIFDLLQEKALYREDVDWRAARAELQALPAGDEAAADALIKRLIARSSHGHGRWQDAVSSSESSMEKRDASPASPLPTPSTMPGDLPRSIGWVRVGPFGDGQIPPGYGRQQASYAFAGQLQQRLQRADNGQRCGWIVDLRDNSGGNMWPMLLGISPLLVGTHGEASVLGGMRAGAALKPWSVSEGQVLLDGHVVLGLGPHFHRLKHPDAPVAVLIGARTASSGEAVALSFRGRRDARSFGEPTGGYSTSNTTRQLVDGSTLLSTEAIMVDRNGQGDGRALIPDVHVSAGGDVITVAVEWLLAHPACGKAR